MALDDYESLAASASLHQAFGAYQEANGLRQILNDRHHNPDQVNERDHSPMAQRHEAIALAAENSTHSILHPNHACYCWREVAHILEKIELKNNIHESLGQSSVESSLSFQRGAVEKCTTMIACNSCRSSSERMMLLALIVDKLVIEFEDLTRACQQEGILHALPNLHSVSSHGQATPSCMRNPTSAFIPSIYFPKASSPERRLFLGDYEVQPSEWEPLVKTLITLYARKLESLISCCRTWATATNRSAMLAMFSKVERRFRSIAVAL
jgi:hypothetical protein